MASRATAGTHRKGPEKKGDACVQVLKVSVREAQPCVEIKAVREKFALFGFGINTQAVSPVSRREDGRRRIIHFINQARVY